MFKHASLNLQLYSWQSTICISFTLFFYHYLTVSSPFLNCLTLIINVLLTYRFTVHGTEKLVFPNIICQRHIHAQLLTSKIDHKFELMNWKETQANTRSSRVCITRIAEFSQVILQVINKTLTPSSWNTLMDCLWVFFFFLLATANTSKFRR